MPSGSRTNQFRLLESWACPWWSCPTDRPSPRSRRSAMSSSATRRRTNRIGGVYREPRWSTPAPASSPVSDAIPTTSAIAWCTSTGTSTPTGRSMSIAKRRTVRRPPSTGTPAALQAAGATFRACAEENAVTRDFFAVRQAKSGEVPARGTGPARVQRRLPHRSSAADALSAGRLARRGGHQRLRERARHQCHPRGGAVRRTVAQSGAAGDANAGERKVRLITVDRSGRTGEAVRTFPLRPRSKPRSELKGRRLDPDGGRTEVPQADRGRQDARQWRWDEDRHRPAGLHVRPQGRAHLHILEIGKPKPLPCAEGSKGCSFKGEAAGALESVKKTLVLMGGAQTTITFAEPSGNVPWSILHTVYDETGAVGQARYDGFTVVAPGLKSGEVQGMPVGALTFSGSCVFADDSNRLFWTKQPISVNGVRLRPASGTWAVVDMVATPRGSLPPARRPRSRAARSGMPRTPRAAWTCCWRIARSPACRRRSTARARITENPVANVRYQGFPLQGAVDVVLVCRRGVNFLISIVNPDVFKPDEGVAAPNGGRRRSRRSTRPRRGWSSGSTAMRRRRRVAASARAPPRAASRRSTRGRCSASVG